MASLLQNTSSTVTGWIFDPTRNQYYYYNAEENAYIYQSGKKIHLNELSGGSGGSGAAQSYDIPRPASSS
jgi:hypothetical protein